MGRIRRASAYLGRQPGVTARYIFGSVPAGRAHAASDLDVTRRTRSARTGRFVVPVLLLHAAHAVPAPLCAQTQLPPEHEAIAFLIGEWHTTSRFPDGRTGVGELQYRWVLGGAWMKVEYAGTDPDGRAIEAHVMQRWSADADEYEAWLVADAGAPLRFRGSVPGPGRYRVERAGADGATIGIDYRALDDGTVRQQNWIEEGGTRRVTLETVYRRRAPPER